VSDHARARAFYEGARRVALGRAEEPLQRQLAAAWLVRLGADGPTLELGCGATTVRAVGSGYVALDLAMKAVVENSNRGVVADMEVLPFRDASIGCVFSIAAMEHVPNPERVLDEIARVLRDGGIAVLAPAWHCRTWAAEGLEFRPYSALRFSQKARKALIPLRNAIWWRAAFELPRRVVREMRARRGPVAFSYDRLNPNLEHYIGTDSDAFTCMDPQAMAIWFASRGWEVVSHRTRRARLLARHEPVVVRKRTMK